MTAKDTASKDAGAAEVRKGFEEDQKHGFSGVKVDPFPNSAHSLESGPDAPTVAEQVAALKTREA